MIVAHDPFKEGSRQAGGGGGRVLAEQRVTPSFASGLPTVPANMEPNPEIWMAIGAWAKTQGDTTPRPAVLGKRFAGILIMPRPITSFRKNGRVGGTPESAAPFAERAAEPFPAGVISGRTCSNE